MILRRIPQDAAACCAVYCAAAGIECHIFTPASAAMGELVQTQLDGATITKVPGSRDEVPTVAIEEGKKQATDKIGQVLGLFGDSPK